MRTKRRPVAFSILGLLEKAWLSKRVKFSQLHNAYPTTSLSVLHANLKALEEGGLVRGRQVNILGRPTFRYWKATRRGLEILRQFTPVRDYWEMVQPRELRALAIAEACREKIQARVGPLFAKGDKMGPGWNYWTAAKSRAGARGPQT